MSGVFDHKTNPGIHRMNNRNLKDHIRKFQNFSLFVGINVKPDPDKEEHDIAKEYDKCSYFCLFPGSKVHSINENNPVNDFKNI